MSFDKAVKIVAFESIKATGLSGKDKDFLSEVEAEEYRIHRMIEWFFIKEPTNNVHFEKFASDFIMENYKAIINGDPEFLGGFIDDVPEPENSDRVDYSEYGVIL